MKQYITLSALLVCFYGNAQKVGINTISPKANLDINGNLMIQTVPASDLANTYDFLVVDPTTNEVQKVNGNFDKNMTIAKGVTSSGLSLLGTAGSWQKINFDPINDLLINRSSTFEATTDDSYIVPSNGIYQVDYDVLYGDGVQLSALNFTGTPSIGIMKTTGGITTPLDTQKFSGAGIGIVKILISKASINTVYELVAGDKLSFQMNSGGLTLSLLSTSKAEFVVRKISD